MKKVWIQCAVTGDFRGHKTGPFSMTADTFDQCVNNFNRDGVDIQWDIAHSSEQGLGSAPAVGWISKLERRGDTLWGLTEWLPETREAILRKQWKYASPAVRFGAKDPKSGLDIGAKLTSMALVSRGFLKDLPPVQASDDQRGDLVFCSEIPVEDDEAEHELIAMADHEVLLDEAVRVATAPLSLQLDDAEAKLSDAKTAAAVAEARATALEARVHLMTDQAIDARVEEAFNNYRVSRNLSPSAKRIMKITLQQDENLFLSEYPRLPNAPGYITQKLCADPSNVTTLSGLKTIPSLASLVESAKTKNPTLTYDQQFDLALSEHNSMTAMAA
jgi:Mu-like prophage I protein